VGGELANTQDTLKKRLEELVRKAGSVSTLSEKAKVSRTQLHRYLNGADITLETLGRLAAAGGLEPWEMLHPQTPERTLAERIDELKAAVTAPPPSPARAGVIALLEEFDDSEMPRIEQILRARLSGKEFAKNPIKPNKLVR
jgi:transcriptional regulator with XRE-family HTH domain